MKKIEIGIVGTAVVLYGLNSYEYLSPWAASAGLLVAAYLYFFGMLRIVFGLKYKQVAEAFKENSPLKVPYIITAISGVMVAFSVTGIIFKLMNFPRGIEMLSTNFILILLSGVSVFFYTKTKETKIIALIIRQIVYAAVGIVGYFV